MTDRPRIAGGRHLAAVLLTAATVVLVDQLTKSLALAQLADGPVDLFWTLRFRLSFNTGIAFSIGSGSTAWITGAAIALVVALLVVSRRVADAWMAAGLGLVLGGAVGNLADRLFRDHGGAVVDFIDLQWWPVFNVADVGISVGALLLVIVGWRDDSTGDAVDGPGGDAAASPPSDAATAEHA